MKPSDLTTNNRPPRICFVGAAGTGKTGLSSQAKNAYCFDFDDGMRTCNTIEDNFKDIRQNIEFDLYEDIGSSVVIDSWTGFCDKLKHHIMSLSGDPFANPQIQHWGMMTTEAEGFLHMARSLQVLLIVNAHENLIETSSGEASYRIASITRGHGMNKMAYLFDEVLRTKARRKGPNDFKYIVTGKGDSTLPTRTRSNIKGDMEHTECGLAGILEKMNYKQ